jgi:hypothetical protein
MGMDPNMITTAKRQNLMEKMGTNLLENILQKGENNHESIKVLTCKYKDGQLIIKSN